MNYKQTNKDKMIVYQNQSHLILEWFKQQNISPKLLDLTLITSLMTDACVDGVDKNLIQRFETMDKYLQDKYQIHVPKYLSNEE